MQNKKSNATGAEKLGFLFSRLTMPRSCLGAWLHSQEFVDRMIELDESKIYIDDEIALAVMKEVYAKMISEKSQYTNFYFSDARRGINHLRNAVEAKQSDKVSI